MDAPVSDGGKREKKVRRCDNIIIVFNGEYFDAVGAVNVDSTTLRKSLSVPCVWEEKVWSDKPLHSRSSR